MAATKIWHLVRALILAYVLSILMMLLLTFLMYRFRLPESQITLGIYAVYILSCLSGGILAGKSMKTRRFFWGLLTGLLYFGVLFGMSFLQEQSITSEWPQILTVMGICAASGMAGGMIS